MSHQRDGLPRQLKIGGHLQGLPIVLVDSRSDKILDLTARSDCSDLCADPFG